MSSKRVRRRLENFAKEIGVTERGPVKDHGKAKRCIVCNQPLVLEGGFAGTDMCGPCATGESDTIEEIGKSW